MIELEGTVGPAVASDGANKPVRLDKSAAVVTTHAHGRFYEAVARGNVYYLATGAAAGTAFTGAAGGTPLIGVFNPSGSGKNLSFLGVSLGLTAQATAAGVVNPEIWAGVSVNPTGTQTNPTSMLTQLAAGSAARGFVNTAMTSSTAVTIVGAFTSSWWATAAAGSATSGGFEELGGLVVAQPGVLVALGLRTIPTSVTVSVGLYWEEIAV